MHDDDKHRIAVEHQLYRERFAGVLPRHVQWVDSARLRASQGPTAIRRVYLELNGELDQ